MSEREREREIENSVNLRMESNNNCLGKLKKTVARGSPSVCIESKRRSSLAFSEK